VGRASSFNLLRSWLSAWTAWLLFAGCTEFVERTRVQVVIDADAPIREKIRYVEVEVRNGPPDAISWDLAEMPRQLVPRGAAGWPLRFSLPSPAKDVRWGYRVTAIAKSADDTTLAEVRALSEYVPGKTLELPLRFDEACVLRTELCPKTFSCKDGECIDPFVDATELPTSSGPTAERTTPAMESPGAAGSSESQAGGGAGAAGSCTGSACKPATASCGAGMDCTPPVCAARDARGTCLPCPPGFLGDSAASCMPGLISLSVSAGKLSPAFDPAQTDYTVAVPLLAETVKLSLSAAESAEISINGRPLAGKLEWTTPALPLGDTDVVIMLTAKGQSSRTYSLKFQRSGREVAQLQPPSTGAGDAFGTSLAVSGDWMIVGAPYEDGSAHAPMGEPDEATKDSGAAFLYERTDSSWVQREYLKAAMPRAGSHFGWNVAIDGKRFAVSAIHDSNGGSVYVYEIRDGKAVQLTVLEPEAGHDKALLGRSLALQGNRLAAGAPGDSKGTDQEGTVYIFDYDGSSWQRTDILESTTPGLFDFLGSSIALDGDVVVSGATAKTVAGESIPSGVAYVFERQADGWKQLDMLSPNPVEESAFFGEAVSVSGKTIAVGGFFGSVGLTGGAAYVFTRGSDGHFTQDAAIRPTNTRAGDAFGERVWVLNADALLIGAPQEASGGGGIATDASGTLDKSGAVYLFSRSSGSWRQQVVIKANMPVAGGEFGIGLGVSGDTIVAGSPADPDRNGSSMKRGSVYVLQ
jgi:hypothetical protein